MERPNRFVLRLERGGRTVEAYCPNPGRMEEFLLPGHPFFLIPQEGRFAFRVFSTFRQDGFLLLDTLRVNSLVQVLLQEGRFPWCRDRRFRREVTMGRSRFDFLGEGNPPLWVEVKSCSLVHRGTVLFPDAPTARGARHLEDLALLVKGGARALSLHLTTHSGARRFRPHHHRDPLYSRLFLASKEVVKEAWCLPMLDPVTVDTEGLYPLEVERGYAESSLSGEGGSYLLLMENLQERVLEIGSLGKRSYAPGWYLYIGSALGGLESRLERHARKRKRHRWHVDSLLDGTMILRRSYPFRDPLPMEKTLVDSFALKADGSILGFGCTDRPQDRSHLLYFLEDPRKQEWFSEKVLELQIRGG